MNLERQFTSRLAALQRAARRRVLLLGVLRCGAVLLPALLVSVWAVGGEGDPGRVLLTGLVSSLVLGALTMLGRWCWLPWHRLRGRGAVADRIEAVRSCRNFVRTAAQVESASGQDDPVGRELRRRVVKRATAMLADLSAADLQPLIAARPVAGGWILALVLAVLLGVAGRGALQRGGERLLNPGQRPGPPPTGGLYALAGSGFAVEGDRVVMRARDFGGGEDAAICQIRVGTGTWQDLPTMEVAPGGREQDLRAPFRDLQAELPSVREDLEWRFRRGARVSAASPLQVRHRPLLTELAGRIVPPAYTRAAARDLPIMPTVSEAPAGGRVELVGESSRPVRRAWIATAAGDTLPLAVAGTEVRGALTVTEETVFRILLETPDGLRNRGPLAYRVITLPDEGPVVRLESDSEDGILPLGGRLDLVVEAADDFGLDQVTLLLRPAGRGTAEEPWRGGRVWPAPGDSLVAMTSALGPWKADLRATVEDASGLQVRQAVSLDLSSLSLQSGDGVEIVAEARDNMRPGSGQVSRSRSLVFQLPSAAEVLADNAREREERTAELEDARRRTRQLGRDLDRLNREIMKNPTPDWNRQQEMEAAIARRKELQKQLQEMAAALQEELDRLASNQMVTERQLDMADQVSQLMQQEKNPYLDGLMQKLEGRPENIQPQDVARTLQEVARNQEDLARRMDMALAMLERMDQEQELAGMTALLEKIMKEQQDLADRSRDLADRQGTQGEKEGGQPQQDEDAQDQQQAASEENAQEGAPRPADAETGSQDEDTAGKEAEELAARQEALARQLEELRQKMEEARDQAARKAQEEPSGQEQSSQMQQTMQEMLDQMEKQQSSEHMQDAGEELQDMDPEQAARMQEQALRDLGSLYHVLLKSQEAMQMAMKQNQVTSLRRIAADLLDLSARQEDIAARIPSRLRNVRTREVARSQHRMQQAAAAIRHKLANLSTEAPLRILPLLRKLDSLIETMGYGVNALEEGQGKAAQRQSRNALSEANNIVIGLLTEAQMNSRGQGQGQQGSPSPAEQLMQMIQQQAGLNGLTEELRRMLADRGLSQEARSRMKRLGQQQGDLAGRMEDLAEKERIRPDRERLLGDLERMAQDLETIGQEIAGGDVSEETLRRQERILSRMLDARNSVRQRDFSMRRESRTAARVFGEPQLGSEEGNTGPDRLRRRYRALEAAPPDYQSLVRRYFTALDSLQRAYPAPSDLERTP